MAHTGRLAKRGLFVTLSIILLATLASAAADYSWVAGLQKLAGALGWVMMVIMGIKWIIAESPNERAEAKKGMLYIVIGLLIVSSMCNLISGLYCYTIDQVPGFSGACAGNMPPGC